MNPFVHIAESTFFAGAVWLATLALRRNRARARHTLWLAASVKFLIPFALLVSLGSHVAPRHREPVPPPQMRFVMASGSTPLTLSDAAHPFAPARRNWLAPALWSIWFAGCLAVLIRWRRQWREAARQARESTVAEPGVFGVFRPVLLLPAGIAERLSPPQLRAVIAHEMCHIRHRDNLAAAVHMLVEALLWFHPLVWWMGARMLEERERACDEEVLGLGNDPAEYALSIVRTCQFCIEPAVPCVSGITGAELKGRIRDILSGRAASRLGPGKKAVLAAMGIAAVAVPLALGMAHPALAPAQTAAPLRFDAASVKISNLPYLETIISRSGGRIHWTTDLGYIIGYAYRLQPFRILGPVPGSLSIFEFECVTGADATDDQIRLMFQSLLADRFGMLTHRETKEVDGYALRFTKASSELREAKDGEIPPLPESFRKADASQMEGRVVAIGGGQGVVKIAGRRVTIQQFGEGLQRQLATAVFDETGLTGKYYFDLEYAREDGLAAGDTPPIFAAIKALGLRLEKHKGPVEMLVVERIEKTPTEN